MLKKYADFRCQKLTIQCFKDHLMKLHEMSKLKAQLKIAMAMQTKERHKLEFKENQTKNAKRGLFYLFIHSRNIY